MKNKWMSTVALIGILSFGISYDVNAVLPQEDAWDTVIKTKVPVGREQLETYKKVYGDHVEKHGETKESYSLDVEGLEGPFSWLYANAYQRLQKFEEQDPPLTQKLTEELGESPTVALKQLYLKHVEDPSTPLSVSTFEGCILDVVELTDLYFHNSEPELEVRDLKMVLSKHNKPNSHFFFSPVFLKKDGMSIRSINFAYFGEGPFLAAVEIGPNRNAHQKLFSMTNRIFIQRHDRRHADDAYRFLTTHKLLPAFQTFHNKIENLKEGNMPDGYTLSATQSYLHMGLFLVGHECVGPAFEIYIKDESIDVLSDAIHHGIPFVKQDLLDNFYSSNERNYVVGYKDSLDSIAKVMENNSKTEKGKKFYKDIRCYFEAKNRKNLQKEHLQRLLNEFEKRFMELAHPLITEVDQELREPKDIGPEDIGEGKN